MIKPPSHIVPYILIAALGVLLFLPMLGSVHLFDWDEINFAESAREMLITGEYGRITINYQPFWEKPPLFIWMQALSMKLLGVNEFAARLPNAVCGIATLMVLFYYGKRYRNSTFGWFWMLLYLGSWLPHAYFKSGIIDPVFNLFMFLGVVQLAQWAAVKQPRYAYKHAGFAGFFIGLAVLTKGPVGLLLPSLALIGYLVATRQWFLRLLPLLLAVGVFLATTFAWYGLETIRNGWWFLGEFLQYNMRLAQTEDSGHGGPFFYHAVVLLLGCFPASIFLLYKPRQIPEPTDEQVPTLQHLHLWSWILLGVVLVVFSIVQTKIVHYSSLAYFPITFLATSALYRWQAQKVTIPKAMILCLAIGVGLIGGALVGGTYLLSTPSGIAEVQAVIAQKEIANPSQPWPFYLVLIGLLYTAGGASGVWSMWRNEVLIGAARLLIVTAVTVQLGYILILPYAENLSQGALVGFLKQHAHEDLYLDTWGFKSYAPYYYGHKKPTDTESKGLIAIMEDYKKKNNLTRVPPTEFNNLERWWHLEGNIDKPVLFVVKAAKKQKLQSQHPQLQYIGETGGYVFFRRNP